MKPVADDGDSLANVQLDVGRAGSNVLFRWAAVADPLGLRGYRISAPGVKPLVVKGTSAAASFAAVRGKKVAVVAVDKAGNTGVAGTVRVSR